MSAPSFTGLRCSISLSYTYDVIKYPLILTIVSTSHVSLDKPIADPSRYAVLADNTGSFVVGRVIRVKSCARVSVRKAGALAEYADRRERGVKRSDLGGLNSCSSPIDIVSNKTAPSLQDGVIGAATNAGIQTGPAIGFPILTEF